MSIFGKLFGSGNSGTIRDIRNDDNDVLQELVFELANNANQFPPTDFLIDILVESGFGDIPIDRLRFALSIANEAINIWLINKFVVPTHMTKELIDLLHHTFFNLQSKEQITLGDFIVAESELSRVASEIGNITNQQISNVDEICTTWWSLMDMVYFQRHKKYFSVLEAANQKGLRLTSDAANQKGLCLTSFIAAAVAEDITGLDSKLYSEYGSDILINLEIPISAVLESYTKHSRQTLTRIA